MAGSGSGPSSAGKLLCLDVHTGKLLWNPSLRHSISGRGIIAAGKVIVPASDSIVTIDLVTGTVESEVPALLVGQPLPRRRLDRRGFGQPGGRVHERAPGKECATVAVISRKSRPGPIVLAAGVAALLTVAARGQDGGELRGGNDSPTAPEVNEAARAAISRGLNYLARHQEPDGAFIDGIGRKVNNTYLAHAGKHVGVTALAGISFLAQGSTPSRGQYGHQVQGCLDFVLRCVSREGFITNDGSRMYEHAFGALFLAEVAGMAPTAEVHEGLKQAVSSIVASQNDQGGWRYLPGAKDSDISITVCQVQALRAARNAGVRVPKDTIDRAIQYVKRSYIGDRVSYPHYQGGFWYQAYRTAPCGLLAPASR